MKMGGTIIGLGSDSSCFCIYIDVIAVKTLSFTKCLTKVLISKNDQPDGINWKELSEKVCFMY